MSPVLESEELRTAAGERAERVGTARLLEDVDPEKRQNGHGGGGGPPPRDPDPPRESRRGYGGRPPWRDELRRFAMFILAVSIGYALGVLWRRSRG
jgi:hypothetical protein